MKKLLIVQYGPGKDSLSKYIAQSVKKHIRNYKVEYLDLAKNIPDIFTEELMDIYVRRNYLQKEVTESEHKKMKNLDLYSKQYMDADAVVLVTPMYNFGVPAAVKAWMDAVAQAKTVFKYTEYGPVGLGKVEQIHIAIVSGSTPKDSARDYMSGHLKTYFEFLGIKNIQIDGVFGSKFMGDSKTVKADEVVLKILSGLGEQVA